MFSLICGLVIYFAINNDVYQQPQVGSPQYLLAEAKRGGYGPGPYGNIWITPEQYEKSIPLPKRKFVIYN